MAWHGMALMLLTGCTPTAAPIGEPQAPRTAAFLIEDDARVHHFGPVIARPGAKRNHAYRLINTTNGPLTIVDVINRRPCCGALALGKSKLAPGEATDLELTLSVGGKFGDVVHEAVVVTDPPAPEEIVLRTTARAYPALRVEPEADSATTLLAGTPPRELALRVFAQGTPDDPPTDLDALTPTGARWLGPKEEADGDEGVTTQVRRLAVVLDPSGAPGERRAAVVLNQGETPVYEHAVAWEIIAPITATPKVLVVRPGVDEYRVLLQSSDGAAFRVTGYGKGDPVLKPFFAEASAPKQTITLRLTGELTLDDDKGTLTVQTDLAAMRQVEIPIVVLK